MPVVVDEPRALAVDEGHVVRARTCRQDRATATRRAHATTAVSPISRLHAEPRRGHRRAQLRDDPALELAGVEQPVGLARRRSPARRRRRASTPGTSVTKRIRSAPRPTASAAAASSALTFSGPAASGATTGIRPAASAVERPRRRRRNRVADEAERRRPASPAGRSRRRSSPTASAPSAAQSAAFTSASDSRTTSSAAAASSRAGRRRTRPRRPRRSISAEICGPAPWTTQTSCPRAASVEDRVAPRPPRRRRRT